MGYIYDNNIILFDGRILRIEEKHIDERKEYCIIVGERNENS